MGKLRVHNIEAQTGTNVDLGAAGDVVTLASDSIQTNLYKDSGGNTLFQSDGSGTLSNVNSAIAGAGPKLISTNTISSATASFEFTSGFDNTYDKYLFVYLNVIPATNAAVFGFQVSTDGGTTYATSVTSTTYYANHYNSDGSHVFNYWTLLGNATAQQKITMNLNNTATNAASGTVEMYSPGATTYVKHFGGTCSFYHNNNGAGSLRSNGFFTSSSALNAIKFYFDSGNVTSGIVKMYGVS